MLLLLTLIACDPGSQATNACRDRREILDALYTRYGGSPLAEATKGGVAAEVVSKADRARFEEQCVLLGRAGQPTLVAKKAKEFFAQPQTASDCRKVVDLEDKLAASNRALPADQQITCP